MNTFRLSITTRTLALLLISVVEAMPAQSAWGQAMVTGSAIEPRLENTYWKLTQLGNEPVIVGERQREPHLILQPEGNRVAGSGGCNRLMGGYQLAGERISFSRMAMTRMACPDGMETERDFVAALEQVKTWKISGQHLELFNESGKLLARFESRELR